MSDEPTDAEAASAGVLVAPRRIGPVPPHNLAMEESLLGSMLLSRTAILAAERSTITSADFYKPSHGHIFDSIMRCYTRREKVDPVIVADDLREHDLLDALGGRQTLLRIQGGTPASANASVYAETVVRHARRRQAIAFAGDLSEMGYDEDHTIEQVVEFAQTIADRIAMPSLVVEQGIDVLDLIDIEFDYRWIVPGLVRRLDRLIVTGLEGFSGKTEFVFQLAVQFASGVHPWTQTHGEYAPVRVLYMDFENALDQLQPRAKRLTKVAGDWLQRGMLTVESMPQGLNIRTAKGFGSLDAMCERHKPDVLITGPIYRMFDGERGMAKHSEEVAEEVTRALDRIRVRHDLALIIEAHAPHGNEGDRAGLRPYGASLWMRWPEIGVGLRPMQRRDQQSRKMVVVPGKFTFDFWRGTRDQDLRRPWPSGVQRWNTWSFIPIDDTEVF